MKCPNCQREVADNYKFCPNCRTRLTSDSQEQHGNNASTATLMNSVKLAATPKPQSFGTPVNVNDKIKVVKNKIIWEIAPGEIARKITETEFDSLKGVSGMIIPEGVTAVIYIDGQPKASLNSGIYNFIKDEDIDNILNKRVENWSSLYGISRKLIRGIGHLICGKKVADQIAENQATDKLKSLDDVIDNLKSNSVISVYLRVNHPFTLLYGTTQNSNVPDNKEFKPYTIRTKYLEIQLGLSLLLEMEKFNQVIHDCLTSSKSVFLTDIQSKLNTYIPGILQDELRSIDIENEGISEALRNKIAVKLTSLQKYIPGFRIVALGKLTYQSDELDRFYKISKDLYHSEKEIDFLHRSNEFKNRLASIQNEQKIKESQSSLDIKIALDDINKDSLLHDEELDKFHMLLSRQKKIREAENSLELQKAFNDIKKTGLLNNDELAALEESLAFKKFDRHNIDQIMRQQSLSAVAKHNLKIQTELLGLKIEQQANLADKEFEAEKRLLNHTAERMDIDEILYGKQYLNDKLALERQIEYSRIERQGEFEGLKAEADIENELLKKKLEGQRTIDDYTREKTTQDDTYQNEQRLKQADIELEIAKKQVEFEKNRVQDELELSRKQKEDEYELYHRQQEDEYDLTVKNQRSAMEMLAAMKAMKQQQRLAEHNMEMEKERLAQDERVHMAHLKHDETLESMKLQHDEKMQQLNNEKDFDAEKLFVSKLNNTSGNKTAEIYAQKFNSEKELQAMQAAQSKIDAERLKMEAKHEEERIRLDEERRAMQERNDRYTEERARMMEDMMKNMMGMAERTMANNSAMVSDSFAGQRNHERESFDRLERIASHRQDEQAAYSAQRYEDTQRQKEEYRQQMMHEQERHDIHQDRALNYTTQAGNAVTHQPQSETSHEQPSKHQSAEKKSYTDSTTKQVTYYVEDMGDIPFMLDTLKGLVRNGIINKQSIISRANKKMYAEDLPELNEAFETCTFVICPHCKTKITEKGIKFCPNCGEDL